MASNIHPHTPMHRIFIRFLAAVAVFGAVCSVSHAQNLVTNPSFETGGFVDEGDGFMTVTNGATTISNWTVINSDLVWGYQW
jgi:hypothetical protein